jgi:hypothetical protein
VITKELVSEEATALKIPMQIGLQVQLRLITRGPKRLNEIEPDIPVL